MRPPIDENTIWTIPYTSGTTGRPKGVMLSHRARLQNFQAKAEEFACFGVDDKFLSITPMNHGPGTSFALNALVFGGSVELLDSFDAQTVLQKLKFGGFSGIFTVPTNFHAFFALDAATLTRCRRPPLKAIISNAAPLPQALKPAIVDYFGPDVLHELYSSTETSLVCNLRPVDQLRKPGSVGLPFRRTSVRIVRDEGSHCDVEEVGELYARSPYLFSGYWNLAAETAAAFDDGWVSVGDLARRDAEGYIYIVGRKKDMVISGGVNIYPREIEDLLAQHPAVAEIAVIGVPDEKWGERLRAFIVSHDPLAITPDSLRRFCAGRLAAYKLPREIVFVSALPRDASGKVLKHELRSR